MDFRDSNGSRSEQPRPSRASGGYIDWKGVKRRTSLSAIFAQSCARLTEEFTGDGARRKDCLSYVAKVRRVLDERLGVPRAACAPARVQRAKLATRSGAGGGARASRVGGQPSVYP